jgi:molybdate/tungstate transport system substrate-binding protein
MTGRSDTFTRRNVISQGTCFLLATALAGAFKPLQAAVLAVLDVAYAGSMGSMMEGPIKSVAASRLRLDMHGRALGSTALANLIVGGSIRADVFMPVTPGPMLTVLQAGKATSAEPIARTEIVIAYSRKSRFATQFDSARRGKAKWWEILGQPGLRFGRTDPVADPLGRNIIFTMLLAARLYGQANLVQKTLGATVNEKQIFSESTLLARLQSGQLDACAAYETQPGPFGLPYISLARQINLSSANVREEHPDLKLTVGGNTYHPEPLIYYAAALDDARNSKGATEFIQWLKSGEAQSIFQRYHYDPPAGASPLRA